MAGIILRSDGWLGIGRGFLGLAAYPPPDHGRRRPAFVEAARHYYAKSRPRSERPPDLRRLKADREITRRVQKGLRCLKRAHLAGSIAFCHIFDRSLKDDDWKSSTPTYAAGKLAENLIRTGASSANYPEELRTNILHRCWKRHRPVLHLALMLIQEMPFRGAGPFWSRLLTDDSWVEPALRDAEVWRLELPRLIPAIGPNDLVPVRAEIMSLTETRP